MTTQTPGQRTAKCHLTGGRSVDHDDAVCDTLPATGPSTSNRTRQNPKRGAVKSTTSTACRQAVGVVDGHVAGASGDPPSPPPAPAVATGSGRGRPRKRPLEVDSSSSEEESMEPKQKLVRVRNVERAQSKANCGNVGKHVPAFPTTGQSNLPLTSTRRKRHTTT